MDAISPSLDRDRLQATAQLMQLVYSGSMSQAACAAAELRLPDLLASGPRHACELAELTGTHLASLHRLLRALASLGLCIECDDGSFELSAAGSILRTDAPGSLRSWTIWYCRHMWAVWGNLLYSVKTGESARKLVTGGDDFGHLERDEQAAAVFNRAMAEMTRLVAREVMRNYDFSGANRIVDVGGGYGALLAAILAEYPAVRGVLFDRPHAMEGAASELANAGLTGRCELVTGDFFTSVPEDADVYLLKAILHDWDDEQSSLILRNCRRAMPATGKLVLVERVMPERFEALAQHCGIARADLTMLIALGGRERSKAEFSSLLDATGFRLREVITTDLEYSVLEALPC